MELKSEVLEVPYQNGSIEQSQIESLLNDIKAEIIESNNEQLSQFLVKFVEDKKIDPTVLSTAIKKCVDDTVLSTYKSTSYGWKRRNRMTRSHHRSKSVNINMLAMVHMK